MSRRLAYLILVAACGGGVAAQKAAPAPSPIASTSPSASTNTSASIAMSSAPAPIADAGPPLSIDLLWETYALVSVSSQVDNATDKPQHLVDRKPETAWNGKTGDLVGAWIKFRIQPDAHVDHALLTVGFDKATAKGDLFTENHRIAKVRVYRNGAPLRDVALDPNDRKPQKIPIDAAGGDFQIEVLEVAAGTKPSWKEIAISELAVMGTPGKERNTKPHDPTVWVGTYDIHEIGYADTTASTYLAACIAWAAQQDKTASRFSSDGPEQHATCNGPKKQTPGKGAIVETARVAERDAPKGAPAIPWFEGEVLALKTASGVKLTNIRLSGKETSIYVKASYKTISESWVGDKLVIDVEVHRVTEPDIGDTTDETITYRTTCETASSVKCQTMEQSKK